MSTLVGEYAPLDMSGLSDHAATDITRRLIDGSWRDWSEAAARVGHCARPIRLHGSCVRVDRTTGLVVDTFSSDHAPLGVLHVRCGNRREDACPSCSRVYARDTFAMVTAGVTGGKTVPESVAANPLLFVTLTAPSFGPVHSAHQDHRRCHPRSRAAACQHGQPVSCMAVHGAGDELVGAPLCQGCYDVASAVVWQWWAPELWRRFTIALRRALARTLGVPESNLGKVASVQYAKVAEYQQRGLVHFHALIRLDGPASDGIGAPAPMDATALGRAVRLAVPGVEVLVPGVDDQDVPRRLVWGRQIDVRIVRAGQRT